MNLAESIQHGNAQGGAGSVAPSLLEVSMKKLLILKYVSFAYSSYLMQTGKAFTARGMQVLEYVGKETMELLITETGIEVDKNSKASERETDEDQLLEEVTFDRCFYIYGGPEQLEVSSLSNFSVLKLACWINT